MVFNRTCLDNNLLPKYTKFGFHGRAAHVEKKNQTISKTLYVQWNGK